ncbi:MAG: hypothetical protein ACR2F2_11355 [Pyrinomonadaceae bacterium]
MIVMFDSTKDINTSENFLKWTEANSGSFFINCKSKNDLRIHKVPCGHFVFNRPVDLAKRKKICSSNRQELETWAKENFQEKPEPCPDCKL